MIKSIFLSVAGLLIGYVNAQTNLSNDLKKTFYEAYIFASVNKWEQGLKNLKAEYDTSESPELLWELAKAEYGVIGACIANENEAAAKKHLKMADQYLTKYLKQYPEAAAANALKSGLLGYKIAFAPMKGIWLGPQSSKYLKKAFEYDDQHPKVWYHKGMYLFHTPSAFGGDLEGSIDHLKKAIAISASKECTDYNWEYLESHAWLGQALAKNGQKVEARVVYQKAFEIEPEFSWVKYVLLPQVN